jgi:hypothetical protein
VQIGRFDFAADIPLRNNTPIVVPSTLKHSELKGVEYELRAAILHRSRFALGGHYVCAGVFS